MGIARTIFQKARLVHLSLDMSGNLIGFTFGWGKSKRRIIGLEAIKRGTKIRLIVPFGNDAL